MTQKNTHAGTEHSSAVLQGAYGPLVGGKSLIKLLGYSSSQAFRQAHFRQTLPITVFEIPHRRGKFAFTEDVEMWLTNLRKKEGTTMP
jgi:hypothetical protein